MSKFCTYCGKELNDASQFCDKCGRQQNIQINNVYNAAEVINNNPQPEVNNAAYSYMQNNKGIKEEYKVNNNTKTNYVPIVIAIILFVLAGICGIGIIFSNTYKGTKVNERIIKEYVEKTIIQKYTSIDTISVEKEDNNYNIFVTYKKHDSKIDDVGTIIALSNYSVKYLLETNSDYNKYIKNVTFSISSPENGYYFIYSDFRNMESIIDAETIVPNLTIEDQNHKKIEISMKEEHKKQKEKYKSQCETYDYKTISRYPEEYKWKKAKFTGKVMQVIEGSESLTFYRVNVTKKTYQYLDIETWDDTIYVNYFIKTSNKDTDVRVLEGDIVNIYGELYGLESYESVMGTTITIPAINAEYIDLAE